MRKHGFPDYQVETYCNRKICKTLFIVSTQMVGMVFIDQNFVTLFLKKQKTLIHVPHQVLKSSKLLLNPTSKFEWILDDIRIEKIISAPIWAPIFFKVSALLDVRHCPKLKSCVISRKTNDATLRKWQKPSFRTQFGAPEIFSMGFTFTSS